MNVINPATGTRPYPAFGQVSWRGNQDSSNYNALSVAVKRSFSQGFLFSGNYTWSHEIDDGSNGSGDGDSLVAQNVNCQACERASGIWDVRHVLQRQRYLSTSLRSGQALLECAGNLARHRWLLGSNFHGHRAHRFPHQRVGQPLRRARHPTATPPINVPTWCPEFHSLHREDLRSGNGSIRRHSPLQLREHGVMLRATYFAVRAHGRSTWVWRSTFL